VGVPRDSPIFTVPPIISGTRKATKFKFGRQIYSQRTCERKPFKNLGEMAAWAYPGTFQFFKIPYIISGMRKATNVKFGRYIHGVHPSKSLLKIWEKRERGSIQGRPKFSQYPRLCPERVKLRSSNLAGIFTASMRTKDP